MTDRSQWCEMVPDGTDTDGTGWNRCTVHDKLATDGAYVCEGYVAPAYSTWLTPARRIVETQTGDMVDGTLLDLFSASVMVQVYDALSPANRDKLAAMSVTKAHTVAFKITKPKGA